MNRQRENMSRGPGPVLRFERGKILPVEHEPVQEVSRALIVNGRELATLVSSPHELSYLIAGFLRFHGLITSGEDIQRLSICDDTKTAQVIVRGELPARIKPALVPGGAAAASRDSLQVKTAQLSNGQRAAAGHFVPDDLFRLMSRLARQAGGNRESGGIHAAAVGEGRQLMLYSEDIGRHNTLDRIAGEALLKGIDLEGKVLLVSGRVSSETVIKASRLGISLVASRTSPTDLAVRLAHEAGITLVGYLRGAGFNVYTHAEVFAPTPADHVADGVTAVILAGGKSTRMKNNKALLPYSGELFIERIHRQLADIFDDVILVTNTPELYRFVPCRIVQDVYPGQGSLAGIHAGLTHSTTPYIFTVACDMPYLNPELIRLILSRKQGFDVVIPQSEGGFEPLHAVYGKGCLPAMEKALAEGTGRIVDCFDRDKVAVVSCADVARLDPKFLSFRNINTPEEYFRFRDEMQAQYEDLEREDDMGFAGSPHR
jgi:FdhD protein